MCVGSRRNKIFFIKEIIGYWAIGWWQEVTLFSWRVKEEIFLTYTLVEMWKSGCFHLVLVVVPVISGDAGDAGDAGAFAGDADGDGGQPVWPPSQAVVWKWLSMCRWHTGTLAAHHSALTIVLDWSTHQPVFAFSTRRCLGRRHNFLHFLQVIIMNMNTILPLDEPGNWIVRRTFTNMISNCIKM